MKQRRYGVMIGVIVCALLIALCPAYATYAATPHTFDSECDLVCNTCGYRKREPGASLASVWIPQGTKPMEERLNFDGETFCFCYRGSGYNAESDFGKMVTAYTKQYNLKLNIDAYPASEYAGRVAAAMAADKPYDIVFFDGWDYPGQIMSNAMTPLNNYITTADLWNEKSKTKGGLSLSVSQAFSVNGYTYAVGGAYLQTPLVIWYNKRYFASAGYSGANDPLTLYNQGQWTWEKLHEMLQNVQKQDEGLYGINPLAPYFSQPFLCSYDTDLSKRAYSGEIVQNLNDPKLSAAYTMLQKMSCGSKSVVNSKNIYDDGLLRFINGETAACAGTSAMAWTIYENMSQQSYSAFGSQKEQKMNVGMVPAPVANTNGLHAVWNWMGYGAGNGATEKGIRAAVAFAKWDSKHNHTQAYSPEMPADIKAASLSALDGDKLRAPMVGLESSAGSLSAVGISIGQAIAMQGQNIRVVLKGYEKLTQKVIDQAWKDYSFGPEFYHTYAAACDAICDKCGAKRENTTAHSYVKKVDKATINANGKVYDQCKLCRYIATKTTMIHRPYSFKLSATTYTYSGSVRTPTVMVKDTAGVTLKQDVDYTVTYVGGCKDVGTYTVLVTMKGKYSGEKVLTFTIVSAETTAAMNTTEPTKIVSGTVATTTTTNTLGSTTVVTGAVATDTPTSTTTMTGTEIVTETDETETSLTSTTVTTSTEATVSATDEDAEDTKNGWLWAVIPLGVLLIGGGLFLILRKR